MAKKSGLFTLLTGFALGAAALFLSKEENRKKVKTVAAAGVKKAQKLKTEYQENPELFKKKVVQKGKKIAATVIKKAQTTKKTAAPKRKR